MKHLKYVLIFFVLVLFEYPTFGQATNVYVTPSGTAVGNCPAGTTSAPNITLAEYNTSSYWGTATGKIGVNAGNTYATVVLVCGFSTFSAGTSGVFNSQGAGTSANPIITRLDTGTTLSAPYWGANGVFSGGDWNTFDLNGGTITATASGSNLANQLTSQVSSCANLGNGTGITIENGTCSNIYVHLPSVTVTGCTGNGTTITCTLGATCPFVIGTMVRFDGITPAGFTTNGGPDVALTACSGTSASYSGTTTGTGTAGTGASMSDEDGGNTYGIRIEPTIGGIVWTNISVINMTIHDTNRAIEASFPSDSPSYSSGFNATGNIMYNINHGIDLGSGNVGALLEGTNTIKGNIIGGMKNWDDDQVPGNSGNHHDRIQAGPFHNNVVFNGVQIYYNQFLSNAGQPGEVPGNGATANAFIYMTGGGTTGSTVSGCYIFRNVFVSTDTVNFTANGPLQQFLQGCTILNNTAQNSAVIANQGGDYCYHVSLPTPTLENNICSTASTGIVFDDSAALTTMDYNDLYNFPTTGFGGTGISVGNNVFFSLANWLTCVSNGCPASHDTHSVNGNPLLNASSSPPYQLTSNSSASWGKGTNLTSAYCGTIPALCIDPTGRVLPTGSTPWDMGAYFQSGVFGVTLSPTSNNYGSINVGSSSSSVTFSLTNNSGTTATSVSPTVTGGNTGDFPVTNSGSGSCNALSGTLTTGNSCTFTVKFSPSAVGSRSTTLSVSYSGGDSASPQTAPLSGVGVVNTYPAPPMSLIVVLN